MNEPGATAGNPSQFKKGKHVTICREFKVKFLPLTTDEGEDEARVVFGDSMEYRTKTPRFHRDGTWTADGHPGKSTRRKV